MDTTRPGRIGRRLGENVRSMSASSDPRPTAPAPGSVANPRRTRLVREALSRAEDPRTDR